MSETGEELLSVVMADIASGDRQSLGKLYDQFAEKVFVIATSILGNRKEAEDLVHDVFLEVWSRAKSYDADRGTVETWLGMIARSRSIDRTRLARWKQRKTSRSLEDISMSKDTAWSRPSSRADRQNLRKVIDQLPADQKAVVMLAYFSGFTSSEIASRLSVPIGTVKSRMRLALGKLRKSLN